MHALSAAPSTRGALIGNSPTIRQLRDQLPAIAGARRTTLVTGATGTGKEVVARALHEHGGNAGPYVAVHCGALPETLIEAELFGHTRGAFTGAVQARSGLIRSAHGGTLFLDEVDSLSTSAQAKLLRFLESGEYRPVGSDRAEGANAWVIAATNKDLRQCVRAGLFREDLLFRLDVMRVNLPDLRLRGSDIELLAHHFLEGAAPDIELSDEALVALRRHDWPGNVRELKHRIERAVVLCAGRPLTVEALGLDELEDASEVTPASAGMARLIAALGPVPGHVDQPGQPTSTAAGSGLRLGRVGIASGVTPEEAQRRVVPPSAASAHSRAPELTEIPQGGLSGALWKLIDEDKLSLAQAVELCEQLLIRTALRVEGENRTRAAHKLGIHVRTIFKKLRPASE